MCFYTIQQDLFGVWMVSVNTAKMSQPQGMLSVDIPLGKNAVHAVWQHSLYLQGLVL